MGGEGGAGPPAVARAGEPAAAALSPGRLSGTFSRTLGSLGVFNWAGGKEVGHASSEADAAPMLHKQVGLSSHFMLDLDHPFQDRLY